jgi:hypothetical protein
VAHPAAAVVEVHMYRTCPSRQSCIASSSLGPAGSADSTRRAGTHAQQALGFWVKAPPVRGLQVRSRGVGSPLVRRLSRAARGALPAAAGRDPASSWRHRLAPRVVLLTARLAGPATRSLGSPPSATLTPDKRRAPGGAGPGAALLPGFARPVPRLVRPAHTVIRAGVRPPFPPRLNRATPRRSPSFA